MAAVEEAKPLAFQGQDKTEHICPVCCTAVDENDEAIICPDCKIAYHKDCWEDNHGCATYGCPSSGCLEPPPIKIPTSECEDVPSGKANPRNNPGSIICPYCQTSLTAGTKFCWSCGRDLPRQQEPEGVAPESPDLGSPQADKPVAFRKKVLAFAACAVFFFVAIVICSALYGDSSGRRHTPYWLYFCIFSGCSGIWKCITGKK